MIRLLPLLALLLASPIVRGAEAPTGKISKVLPLFLDSKGRSSLSPSLFERDAYQDLLRKSPAQRSTLSFEVQWDARAVPANGLTLRLELRTSRREFDRPFLLETACQPGRWFSTWTQLRVPTDQFKALGEVTAWRATLWLGEAKLAEQTSFLW